LTGRKNPTVGALPGFPAPGPLLEREGELAALRTAIGDVVEGRARMVMVAGSAGIGKTRLLAEARRLATEADVRVLVARGGELEREFAFGVVRQLFEGPVAGDPSALRGAAAPASEVFEPGEHPGDGFAEDPSFALLHGLYWVLVNLVGDAPMVIVVDDLHWCDGPSLRFLAYLVRRLEDLPLLVLGSVRPAERRREAASLAEIAGDPLTVSIDLGPLSKPAAFQLVRERLGEDAEEPFAIACHAITGGNPLLLGELLKTLADEGVRPSAAEADLAAQLGPRAASRAVLVRLARLPEGAVKLAGAAAVLGDGSDLSAAAALAGIELGEAGSDAAALVGAEILRAEPPLAFTHPLVRAVVYEDIPGPERPLSHARAAEVLADLGAAPERVAAHLLASPARGKSWVSEILLRVGRTSLRRGAAESAVTYLTRALDEPPPVERRADVLLELSAAEALISGPAAVEHLSECYELLDDPRARGRTAQLLARALFFTGRPAEGAALARRAAAELPRELDDLRAELEASELITVLLGGGDPEDLERLERHRTLPVGPALGDKMLAAVAAQQWALAGGPSEECAELSLQALAGGDLIAADNGLLGAVAIITLTLADREEALSAWEVALGDAHRRGSLFAKSVISLWRGFTLYRRGELADAEASLRTAGEEFALWEVGGHEVRIHRVAIMAAVLRERGDLAGARRALEEMSDPGDRSEASRFWCNSRLELLVAEGRFEEGLAVAEDFERRFGFLRHPIDTPARSHHALVLDRLGRRQQSLALAERELELARRWGAPATLARALRIIGGIEREAGLERLREAAEVSAGSPARLEHAKALAALGTALRRARRPTEARQTLRRALELADACAARALADHVRTELYAAGGRPRRTALRGPAALTASERRVAAMAADGHTNREIAQTLFVTPKTVELHLRNTYKKLGIRSRHELPSKFTTPD
jgi:DNA-binding CsgD family transcriptional regulator